MKMQKNMTCWPPFSRQRNKASGQSLRLQWRIRGRYNGGAFTKAVNRRRCAYYRLVHSWHYHFAGLSSNLAYMLTCLWLCIGTDSIGSLIKRFAAKKAGVEMVEINNQREAFIDMLAWSEELITDVKTRNRWLWRHCRRKILLITPITTQTCPLNPKLKSTGAGRCNLSTVGGCYRKQLGLKDFSPRKVRTLWHCSRLRGGSAYLIDRGDIRQANRPLQQYLGFTAGRWLWSVRA